eukprot:465232-Amphidinium_carterae.1
MNSSGEGGRLLLGIREDKSRCSCDFTLFPLSAIQDCTLEAKRTTVMIQELTHSKQSCYYETNEQLNFKPRPAAM